MFSNNFDPVAFNLMGIDIRWYSLSYIFGILLGWLYINKRLINGEENKVLFSDYITYLILGVIIGGRLGYVLFYDFNYYLKNPVDIIFIWQGGMSFHGGLIGVILSSFIFSKYKKIKTFYFLDLVSLAAPIGIFFGRIANFINSELYGRYTDLPWAVKFIQVDNITRHPSQIYEAFFEGIILFIILNFVFLGFLKRPGVISGLFLIIYSIFRFFIEFTREPDLHLGLLFLNLSLGQLISLITIIIGIIIVYFKYEKNFFKN